MERDLEAQYPDAVFIFNPQTREGSCLMPACLDMIIMRQFTGDVPTLDFFRHVPTPGIGAGWREPDIVVVREHPDTKQLFLTLVEVKATSTDRVPTYSDLQRRKDVYISEHYGWLTDVRVRQVPGYMPVMVPNAMV